MVSGEVKTVAHLIREDSHSRYMPTCGLTVYGPVMGITHDPCIMELIMLLFLCYHQLVPHWSPISCVLPFLGRLGPACAEVGSGFAVVGLLRRFCLSSHPSAGLGPSPSASAFLFPCLFRVRPLRARCVCVGVFSFPLLWRSPSLCPG